MGPANLGDPHRPTAADVECVERVRRLIAWYDRRRPLLVGLYALLLVAFLGGLAVLSELFQGGLGAALGPGFAAGAAIGVLTGLTAVKLTHALASALFSGRESDRLLVWYHDAWEQLAGAGHRVAVEPAGESDRGGM